MIKGKHNAHRHGKAYLINANAIIDYILYETEFRQYNFWKRCSWIVLNGACSGLYSHRLVEFTVQYCFKSTILKYRSFAVNQNTRCISVYRNFYGYMLAAMHKASYHKSTEYILYSIYTISWRSMLVV